MNNTLFIVAGVSIAIVVIFLAFDYLKYKKIDVKGSLEKVQTFLKNAESYTEAATGLTSGKLKEALEFTSGIEKLALTGCGYAEQLLASAQITDDADGKKRKAAALEYIYTALQNQGIEITDNVKLIVSGIVENTVFSDKTIAEVNAQVDKLIQEKVTSLQSVNSSLQQQVSKLSIENSQLKEKVTIVQNAIEPKPAQK